ncbi:response regulator transcription factor [bacterium LRH843]|nr:response regulator transcription factor [bacterium LRH843]
MSNKPLVLVIEDEPSIRKFIVFNLKHSMFEVIEAGTGKEAFEYLTKQQVDFVILDIMLPDMDGFTICETIRTDYPSLPIIILSARGQDMDKITGLELGADDYLIKPFNPLELIARVRSVLRRTRMDRTEDDFIRCGPFTLDKRSKKITKLHQPLQLTQREYKLMELFMIRKNEALSRDDLLNHVWGKNYFGDVKTVDVHIRRLREKIEDQPSTPQFIETVWGFGYRFQEARQ